MGRLRLDLERSLSYNARMNVDKYGQLIFLENDLCDLYLRDPEKRLLKVFTETEINFPDFIDNVPHLNRYVGTDLSIEDFDTLQQSNWHMPDSYKNMDIAQYVLDQCNTDAELQRAGEELLLFQERDMFDLLKYMKYLVDTMRKHNIVWGVGRGSSVASFVLYLIGIHKINSLYFDLPIEEFLK